MNDIGKLLRSMKDSPAFPDWVLDDAADEADRVVALAKRLVGVLDKIDDIAVSGGPGALSEIARLAVHETQSRDVAPFLAQ